MNSEERNILLKVESLSYKYHFDNVHTIYDLSFEVEKGKDFSLPLEYGKTTLVRLICGLLTQYEGHIIYKGVNIEEIPVSKRNIAVIFADYALINVTVRKNIEFGLKQRGVTGEEMHKAVELSARRNGVLSILDKKVARLSPFEKFLTALARADAREIDLLILDDCFTEFNADEILMADNYIENVRNVRGCSVLRLGNTAVQI